MEMITTMIYECILELSCEGWQDGALVSGKGKNNVNEEC